MYVARITGKASSTQIHGDRLLFAQCKGNAIAETVQHIHIGKYVKE